MPKATGSDHESIMEMYMKARLGKAPVEMMEKHAAPVDPDALPGAMPAITGLMDVKSEDNELDTLRSTLKSMRGEDTLPDDEPTLKGDIEGQDEPGLQAAAAAGMSTKIKTQPTKTEKSGEFVWEPDIDFDKLVARLKAAK